MPRAHYSESTVAEQSTTGDTAFHGCEQLVYTPGASETWYELASAQYRLGATGSQGKMRYDDGSTYNEVLTTPRSTTDKRAFVSLHRHVAGGSPSAQTRNLEMGVANAGNTIYVTDANIVAIKHAAGDQYGENLTDQGFSGSQNVAQDIVTIVWDPGSTRTYTVIAVAELACPSSTGQDMRIRILNPDGTTVHGGYAERPGNTADWKTSVVATRLTFGAGSKTIKLQLYPGGSGTHRIRNAKLLLLVDDGFDAVQADEDEARTTSSGTTAYVTKSSVTFTPAAQPHLVIQNMHLDRSGSIPSSRFYDGTTERHHTKPDPPNSSIKALALGFHIETPAAASTTFSSQASLDASGSTLGMQGSLIFLGQMTPPSGGAAVALDGKAAIATSAKATLLDAGRALTAKSAVATSALASLSLTLTIDGRAPTTTSAKATTINVGLGLAAKAPVATSAHAELARAVSLDAKAPISSSARASLGAAIPLTAKAAVAVHSSALLGALWALTGNAAVATSARAELLSLLTLAGRADIATSANASASITRGLDARAPTAVDAHAALSLLLDLAGTAPIAVDANGDLTLQGQQSLEGVAAIVTSAHGDLSVAFTLTGVGSIATHATATLARTLGLDASAPVAIAANAAATIVRGLSGSSAVAASARAELSRALALAGAAAVAVDANGNVTRIFPITGTADIAVNALADTLAIAEAAGWIIVVTHDADRVLVGLDHDRAAVNADALWQVAVETVGAG